MIPMTPHLQAFLSIQRQVASEAVWVGDGSTIKATVLDLDRILMADLVLETPGLDGPVGVDLDWLAGWTRDGDAVGLSFTDGAKVHGIGWRMRHPNLDLKAVQKPEVPKLDLRAGALVDGGWLRRAVRAASRTLNDATLRLREDVVTLEARGDAGWFKATCPTPSGRTKLEARSGYGLEYLSLMVEHMPETVEVTLDWGDDVPLRLSYVDGPLNVAWLLAPRIGGWRP